MALRPKIVKLIDKYSQKRGTSSCMRLCSSFPLSSRCCILLTDMTTIFIFQKADLVSMNETFVRARNIFDRMMEESLARHTAGA